MGYKRIYKRIGKNLSFGELAVSKSLENNRCLERTEKINEVIEWTNIEAVYRSTTVSVEVKKVRMPTLH